MKNLFEMAKCARALQLFYHHCHNNTRGISFHADHSFFAESYAAAEEAYDSCIEKLIGLTGKSVPLMQTVVGAAQILKSIPECKDVNDMYLHAKALEVKLIALCKSADSEASSVGVKNLVGGIADEAEGRVYKIQQRLSACEKSERSERSEPKA